jgi:hypothetical protein
VRNRFGVARSETVSAALAKAGALAGNTARPYAEALEKRADAIHEWPFEERTPTIVITIATSVTAMTIGRLILDPLGL